MPFDPQIDGQTECINQVSQTELRRNCSYEEHNCAEMLANSALEYNNVKRKKQKSKCPISNEHK